jgi:hypothetical protein
LNQQLTVHVAAEADQIENLWERAYYLVQKGDKPLWQAAVAQYITNSNLDMFQTFNGRSLYGREFKITFDDLVSRYNINVKAFESNNHKCSARGISRVHNANTKEYDDAWNFIVHSSVKFVIQDTKTGALARAKNHYRKLQESNIVFVLAPADKTKPMKLCDFFEAISNPPKSQICFAGDLDEKPRKAGMARDVSIMTLEPRGGRGRNSDDQVWRAQGTLDQFSDTETYYYLPIKGFGSLGKVGNVKSLCHNLNQADLSVTIFGVRKADLEQVKSLKNWVNLDEYVETETG